MTWLRASLPALLLAVACARSTFDARLRAGDVEGALAAFENEAERRRPDAMLQVAFLLRERGTASDSAASRRLLEALVREHAEAPEARAASAVLRLEQERAVAHRSVDSLTARVRVMETEAAERDLQLRQIQRDMILQDSLVLVLTRTAARLEAQLELERRELDELRRTLEQLMEVDLDRPPVRGAPALPGRPR